MVARGDVLLDVQRLVQLAGEQLLADGLGVDHGQADPQLLVGDHVEAVEQVLVQLSP